VVTDDLFGPWLAEARQRTPGLDLVDAHTHFGQNDPDEFRATPAELIGALEAAGADGVVFPMHEPGGYPDANDRVIAEAEASGGRLTAFCRLDPAADPLAEAERALAAGAKGIKLHPRAEDFPLDTPELEPVFALADERNLPVLVHAGRGIPALGRHAVAICGRHPGLRLILAHAGICDLAWIWRAVDDHPNLFFDTSWWSASDLMTLWTHVPPGNILFASDAPYATPAFAALNNLRYATQAGLGADQLKVSFGAQTRRLLERQEPLDAGPAPGPQAFRVDPLLDRVHTFLVASLGQMFNGLPAVETLNLAALACEVGDDAPQAEACETVLRLLELREQRVAAGIRDGRPERFAPEMSLVVAAAAITRTPDVPMPPVGEALTGVDERAADAA
jgi:uncharacterized protein